MKKRGMQLGKRVVLAVLCVVMGLGSVLQVNAAGKECPNCHRNTLYVYETKELETENMIKCHIAGHVDCYMDRTFHHAYVKEECTKCSYSRVISERIDLIDERHYSYTR